MRIVSQRSDFALLRIVAALTVVCGLLTIAAPLFGASKEKVLYSFQNNGSDGNYPYASLISDTQGNLYGTTSMGGAYGYGAVFELSPVGGTWTETVLYSFCSQGGSNCTDGADPVAALIQDSNGNFYGSTTSGGAGCGTVFELTPAAGGGWTETVLHSFTGTDGCYPYAGVVSDASGNLYGTTFEGGAYDSGAVFELTLGDWTETVLHSFHSRDGRGPAAGLIFDAKGDLYGTTFTGGGGTLCHQGCGTVFELHPTGMEAGLRRYYMVSSTTRTGTDR